MYDEDDCPHWTLPFSFNSTNTNDLLTNSPKKLITTGSSGYFSRISPISSTNFSLTPEIEIVLFRINSASSGKFDEDEHV